jgi:hypothetical protein
LWRWTLAFAKLLQGAPGLAASASARALGVTLPSVRPASFAIRLMLNPSAICWPFFSFSCSAYRSCAACQTEMRAQLRQLGRKHSIVRLLPLGTVVSQCLF